MSREKLAQTLREIAAVKKQTANNPFSAKSYLKAANIISELSEPIDFHDFPNIKGFGPKICSSIREFLDTGKIEWLEEKRKKYLNRSTRFFRTMNSELIGVHGIGYKTAKLIYQETGIITRNELEEAIDKGHLDRLFQTKTLENFKKQLQFGVEKRMPREEGLKTARKVMRSLKKYYDTMDVMGSYRRLKSTVGDIDFMAHTDDRELLMEKFCSLKYATKMSQGLKKSQIRIKDSEIKIDLYIFEKDEWGPAQQFLTGSGTHNRYIREIAIQKGMLINQYGVFDREDYLKHQERFKKLKIEGETEVSYATKNAIRLDDGTEESVYNVVGFDWIPPESRNGTDEFRRYKI